MSAPAYQSNNRLLFSSVEDVPLHDVRLDLPDHCEAADATNFEFRDGAHQFDGTYTVKDVYSKSTDHNPVLKNGNNSASTLPGDMYDNSASKSPIQRGMTSRSHRFIGPFASLRRRQIQLVRNSRFHGWRMGVLLACCMSFFVLCCNIALLAVGTTRNGGYNVSESGIVTLFIGDESKITRLNTIFHVFINVLSSLLLAGSNYTMQVLSSPTRQEVDTAHRQRDWLAIGLLSPRNWKRIARKRALLCLILGLSSVPLHLFYNATIFKVVVRNIYSSSAIDMHSSNYTALAANTSYVKLTNEEWKSSFSGMYSSSYSNLILVFDEIEVTTTYNRTRQPKMISITRGDFSFVYGAGYNLASKISESNRLSWTERSSATPGVSIHIAHALAAPSHTRSRVQLSLNFMIVVISANFLKLLIMLGVLITDRSNYLVTLYLGRRCDIIPIESGSYHGREMSAGRRSAHP
ncbi:hypothetical protein C7974DRAFT_17012 [Boeremia exigua]|uniref:uncharacterized protein n=1 Tax=Boeremia exigua TaxID=749465 RepID=UPI001E8E65A6|nr:uncharacterized protein C7974DRAFT_17012 [Boeremia exigua]KAH6644216.1 hypothetical protein C7974DRAFT_17012 [Boeremia exigua]